MTSFPFNAADFGAIGDGISKATNPLQNAIDACHDAGGGKVLLPAGRYLCGTLFLKSNVELHLESGAVILGSPDVDDYNDENLFPENQAFSSEHVTARHLIIAYCQENISITGQGIIDGGSSQFSNHCLRKRPLPIAIKQETFRLKNGAPGRWFFSAAAKMLQCAISNCSTRPIGRSLCWDAKTFKSAGC